MLDARPFRPSFQLSMKVYVSKDGKRYGPYVVEEVRRYVEAGNFVSTSHSCVPITPMFVGVFSLLLRNEIEER